MPYTFGAKFEPPEGMCVQGVGQWADDNATYIATLDGVNLPASHATTFNAGPQGHPHPTQEEMLARIQAIVAAGGGLPNIGVEFRDFTDPDADGVDTEFATTTDHDFVIERLAWALNEYGGPALITIGWECNSTSPGYHVEHFVTAWLKVRSILLAAGVTRCAFGWGPEAHYGPHSPSPSSWDPWNPELVEPGSVDWFVIDAFKRSSYFTPSHHAYQNFVEFVDVYAETYGKPVWLREVQCVGDDLPYLTITTDPGEGSDTWNYWFVTFFDFLDAHPNIKGFNYDGTENPPAAPDDWLDSRLDTNSTILARWRLRMANTARFINSTMLSLLNGFDDEPAPEPETVTILKLTDKARVKALMGEVPGTSIDAPLQLIIDAVSADVALYLDRELNLQARTVQLSPRAWQRTVALAAYPVSASPAAVFKEASDRDFAAAEAIPASGYFLDRATGLAQFDDPLHCGAGTLQVVYTGGLVTQLANDAHLPALEAAYPDIVLAATMWAKVRFDQRHAVGVSSRGVKGSFQASAGVQSPPAEIKQLLQRHRRLHLGG